MAEKAARTASIWLGQIMLTLCCLFFSILVFISLIIGESIFWGTFYAIVLVLFPIGAQVGIAKRATWGLRLAQVSFLCLFAFILKFGWWFWTTMSKEIPETRLFDALLSLTRPFQLLLLVALIAFFILPFLLYKLGSGRRESMFFAATENTPPALGSAHFSYINDPIPSLDESFLHR